jgi:hypothetical protein
MKDCANNVVRYFMKQINDIRDTFKQDQTDITNLFQEVNTQLNVLKEADRFITKEVNLCEYRLNNCEKEIGYHLLGKKEHKDNILKEKEVNNETERNMIGISNNNSMSENNESKQSQSENESQEMSNYNN